MSTQHDFLIAAEAAVVDDGRALFNHLRRTWSEVPGGIDERVSTEQLIRLSDRELRDHWAGVRTQTATGPGFSIRGWYHELYAEVFRGRRVLEVGGGMGIDGLHFVAAGARWHFADIVPSNLMLIRRTLDAHGLHCDGMTIIHDLRSIADIPGEFDFIFCQGSLINLPFATAALETRALLTKLRPGGRWIELCYPRERWERDGRPPASSWGRVTDGESTPWVEWYDLDRLIERFGQTRVSPVLNFNFHGDDFNWFDLRIDGKTAAAIGEIASVNLPVTAHAFRTHGNVVCQEEQSGGVSCVTPPQQWHYAMHTSLPLNPASQRIGQVVEVRARALSGVVGVGLLDDGFRDYLGTERHLDPEKGNCVLNFPVPETAGGVHVMFRNTAGSGLPSAVAVESVRLRSWGHDLEPQPGFGVEGEAVSLTRLVHRQARKAGGQQIDDAPAVPVFVRAIDRANLDAALGFSPAQNPHHQPPLAADKPVWEWRMESDDAPILAYIYRRLAPRRHLEFGTWEGFGAVLCATNCAAHIWTLNLPDGERDAKGQPVYARNVRPDDRLELLARATTGDAPCQTDAGPFIGWRYRDAGVSERITQLLADSRLWDSSPFSNGFFDSILIDGGHDPETVVCDTLNSIRLVRAGGLVMWHDFCPADSAMDHFVAVRGVAEGLHRSWWSWSRYFDRLFWIRPSFLLVGVRNQLEILPEHHSGK